MSTAPTPPVIEEQDAELDGTSDVELNEFQIGELDDIFGSAPDTDGREEDPDPDSGNPDGGTLPVVEEPLESITPEDAAATPPAGQEPTPPATPPASDDDAMRAEMLRMAELLQKHGINPQDGQAAAIPTPVTTPPAQPAQAAPTPPAEVKLEDIDFIGDQNIDDLIENKQGLNKILNQVRTQAIQHTLGTVPSLVNQVTQQMISVHLAVQDFYSANEDLLAYKPFVGMVSNEIASKNPALSLQEVLNQTAEAARTRLRLPARQVKPTPTPAQTPAARPNRAPASPGLPGARATPRPPQTPAGGRTLSDEIADLL